MAFAAAVMPTMTRPLLLEKAMRCFMVDAPPILVVLRFRQKETTMETYVLLGKVSSETMGTGNKSSDALGNHGGCDLTGASPC